MCGICGIVFSGDRETGRTAVDGMIRSLRHRGPDDVGVIARSWSGGRSGRPAGVVLGHSRLSIIDCSSAGHQPMSEDQGKLWITYNGEVYNFLELRRDLEREGVVFRSQTDTEVILYAYLRWGLEAIERFRGMFAMALWDERPPDRPRLVLVRDRLGIKPLYYALGRDHFVFASEVRAILRSGWVPPRLSRAGLLSYLTYGSIQAPLTIIEGIRELLPGHFLVVEIGPQGGMVLREEEYWDIPTGAHNGKRERPGDHVARIRALLEESIHQQLVSDVPIGAFLSGGIDSSAVVALMSQASPSRPKTISVVFGEREFDESRYSRTIAERFGTEHYEFCLTEGEMLPLLPKAIESMDQPTVDGINTYIVSRVAKAAGLTVTLSGLGGDEAFGGYDTFHRVPRMEGFLRWWHRLPRSIQHRISTAIAQVARSDRSRKFAYLVGWDGVLAHPYCLARMLFTPQQQGTLLPPDVFEGVGETGSDRELFLRRLERAMSLDPINRISYLEMKNYLPNTLLRDTDFMSMAHALEVRVPLIDHQLVEYLAAVRGEIKLRRGFPKPLLVEALRGLLPDEVVFRPKRGFTLPFARWLRQEMRTTVEETLLTPTGRWEGVLAPEGVAGVWRDFLRGSTSWSRVWAVYVLKHWTAAWCDGSLVVA